MPVVYWIGAAVAGAVFGGGVLATREIGKGVGKSIPYAVGAVGLYYILKARK